MNLEQIKDLWTKNRVILERAGWYVAGGFVNYAINAGLYAALYYHLGLPHGVAYLISLACAMAALFIWNYKVNFRTQRTWQGALPRYLLVQAVMFLANYSIVFALHHLRLGIWWVNILFAQLFPGVFKFIVYHAWVFPHRQPPAAP
jgi:putative flippase GtrA